MANKKFVYFLADSPNYPNEIWAQSKAEVRQLLLETIPDETAILKIIEANPQNNDSQNPENFTMDSDDFSNGGDYFNNLLNSANKICAVKEQDEVSQKNTGIAQIQQMQQPFEAAVPSKPQQETKYFEEAGIKFKLENGCLFKKVWVSVNDGDSPEYRILNAKTGKPITADKFRLEKLEWQQIE